MTKPIQPNAAGIPQEENGEWLWMSRTADGLDREAFLSVFKESTLENLPGFYPGLPQPEALRRYETDFWNYICGDFQKEGGILAILGDAGGYRASVRLYPQGENTYYIEALETRPGGMERGCTGGLSPGWKRPKGKSASAPTPAGTTGRASPPIFPPVSGWRRRTRSIRAGSILSIRPADGV